MHRVRLTKQQHGIVERVADTDTPHVKNISTCSNPHDILRAIVQHHMLSRTSQHVLILTAAYVIPFWVLLSIRRASCSLSPHGRTLVEQMKLDAQNVIVTTEGVSCSTRSVLDINRGIYNGDLSFFSPRLIDNQRVRTTFRTRQTLPLAHTTLGSHQRPTAFHA